MFEKFKNNYEIIYKEKKRLNLISSHNETIDIIDDRDMKHYGLILEIDESRNNYIWEKKDEGDTYEIYHLTCSKDTFLKADEWLNNLDL